MQRSIQQTSTAMRKRSLKKTTSFQRVASVVDSTARKLGRCTKPLLTTNSMEHQDTAGFVVILQYTPTLRHNLDIEAFHRDHCPGWDHLQPDRGLPDGVSLECEGHLQTISKGKCSKWTGICSYCSVSRCISLSAFSLLQYSTSPGYRPFPVSELHNLHHLHRLATLEPFVSVPSQFLIMP
jgi:hypothetical protein